MPRRLQHISHAATQLLERSGIPAHPRIAAGVVAGVAACGVATWLVIRNRRPSAEELERRRREWLTETGRLTDGSIVDARTLSGHESVGPTPEVLLYRYRIGGVTYDCAQDVSQMPDRTAGYRLDQPVQVRYDHRNPGNSIVVSEEWSGLRMKPQRVLPFR